MRSSQNNAAARRVIAAVRFAAVAGCAGMLAGCIMARGVPVQADTYPTDVRNRHPIALSETPRTVELFIGTKRGSLNGQQRAEVLAFAREWRREATGGILIDVPSGTSNERSAAHAAAEVRSILHNAGVPQQAVEVRPLAVNDPRKLATLKLRYPRVTADAGPCGLWPHDLGPTADSNPTENRQYWNLGCAHQRNLAAMVDNPADLVQPRADVPSYTGRRTIVLDKYHRGEASATTYPNADKGKISDVGQ